MILSRVSLRRWVAPFTLILSAASLAASDLTFTTPDTLSTEAQTLVTLLEQAHYNRDAVHSGDYAQVIPEYMKALDGQHLFFLDSDRAQFVNRFGKNVYYNVDYLGKIDAAYDMFYIYDDRVTSRVAWIFGELKKPIDFTAEDNFRVDRSESQWPTTTAEADELWKKRLKFEVLAELLNNKNLDQARDVVRKRYERLLKNVGETEGSELAETFLTTIAGLYDPHSTYFSADTYEDFGIQMKLKLVGIGAMLGLDEDICTVKEIVPGGPADLGHQLKPNDKIIAVAQGDAEPVEIIGMKLRKIVDQIRGDKGTKVRLIVQPARRNRQLHPQGDRYHPRRREARLRPGEGRGLPGSRRRRQDRPARRHHPSRVLRARRRRATRIRTRRARAEDVAKLIVDLKQAKVQGIVLDLRHNGGGYLSEAIELAGLFIHQGPVVQVKGYDGEITVDSDKAENLSYDGPMAVLVDRFSASASEIVAGRPEGLRPRGRDRRQLHPRQGHGPGRPSR